MVFRRRARALRISWLPRHLSLHDTEAAGWLKVLTRPVFARVVRDVHAALEWGLAKRLTPKDDFDVAACLRLVAEADRLAPGRDNAALQTTLAARHDAYLHRIRTEIFHAKINADWDALHPDSAHLLFHADLWNETDERVPQGSMLGRGLLAYFAHYEAMTLAEVLTDLKLAPYEAVRTEAGRVCAVQAGLGLDFTYTKMRGTVPAGLAD